MSDDTARPASTGPHATDCACCNADRGVVIVDPHTLRNGDQISLTGRLVCHTPAELLALIEHAPAHVAASRAEPGCLMFDMRQTEDPMVWTFAELFRDAAAYEAHRDRTRASAWGLATAGIERAGYDRRGLDDG